MSFPYPAIVRIVLVRPRNPLNIGAAARAMANFGFDDLVVVNPYEPVWRETTSAVGAEALVLNARVAKSLDEAVGDCQLVLGTTSVRGRRLDRPVVRLPDLQWFLGGCGAGRIALLFGPEKTGLTEKYLERCNAYVTIPTSPETPSMNLSHSVAVCCYELSKKDLGVPSRGAPLASADDKERLVKHALELFDAAGYLDLVPPAQKSQKIRRSFLQWNLRATDVRILHGLFTYMMRRMPAPNPKKS